MQLLAKLTEIYSGASNSSTARWVPQSFQDKIVFASPGAPLLYWPGVGPCRPVPGLPDSSGWDGVVDLGGILLLWRGHTMKWCAANDFSLWIPVSVIAASGRALVDGGLRQPAVGSESDWVYLRGVSGSYVPGAYVRIVAYEDDPQKITYDYYTVGAVGAGSVSARAAVGANVPAGGSGHIFTVASARWLAGVRLAVAREASPLAVVSNDRGTTYSYGVASDNSTQGVAAGAIVQIALDDSPALARSGDYVTIGATSADLGADVYRVIAVSSLSLTLERLGVGTAPVAEGIGFSGCVTFQPYVEVSNSSAQAVQISAEDTVSVLDCVTLVPLGLTGATAEGTELPDGAVLETVPVNEAGELANVGASVSGRIFGVTGIGDYGYVFKERSVQSLQPVAASAGTFTPRLEVPDEGPVGRYAWCRAGEQGVYFWGHKGWYRYSGGPQLTPFGVMNWVEVNNRMDRSRADEIIAYHNEAEKSIWFVYPAVGGTWRVVIFNYLEETLVEDAYTRDISEITAIGAIDWELGDTWESVAVSERWNSTDKRWYEFVTEPERRYTIIGAAGVPGNPADGERATDTVARLLVHGREYSRAISDPCDPKGHYCYAETPDFDFDDPALWKYVDTVQLGVVAEGPKDPPSRLAVEVGAKANLDDPITWVGPGFVDVSGGLNGTTKVNLRAAGRYIRLRFSSQQAGVRWRISWYRIIARLGGSK